MKILFKLIIAIAMCLPAQAQQVLTTGTILFERKVNTHKQLDENTWNAEWTEAMKKKVPKYKLTNFDLSFNTTETMYKKSAVQPPAGDVSMMGMMEADEDKNVVYKNYADNKLVAQKQMFEKLVLLQDSLPKTEWKLMNEYKMIAGYNCRKATTIMFDSVYIIAFYTDAIYTSSGPESFNGLPGMILGLHVPRLNTTYMAKKIEPMAPANNTFTLPINGSKYNYKDMVTKLSSALGDWGNKWKNKILWGMLL
jgi:GLPGLI family protein